MQLLKEDMPKLVGTDDRVLFYFAGHGIALDSDDNPKGYLVPTDAKPGETESLVSMDLLHDAFTSLPCQHGILIMDCCFAGSFKWSTGFRDIVFDLPAIIYEERFYQYAQDPAWQVITSSASDQKAVDILSNRTLGMRNESGAEHSPFALALLEGLAGEADTVPKGRGDGVITATELYTYLRDRVEDETTEHGKRQSPSIFSLGRHDKGQYIFFNPRHPLNLPPIPKRNPFMGLKSYNETDSLLFFGRDRVVDTLEEMAENHSFIVASGASGTGKSSVIKAGLLPLLRKKGWHILPVVRPGKAPMQALTDEIPDMGSQLNDAAPTLLIIDQYEELITQCLDPEERLAFETQLASWLMAHPQLRIVISVRADFEPQFEHATLAKWWLPGRYVVPAFSQNELREVIIKPTIQEVLFFEPDSLVDKLVDAVNQAPGALPLLSFTLSELYYAYIQSGRTNRALTLEDYEKLGGVIGALRTRANAIYDGLDEAHQDSMRQLMMRMVSLEGGELASRRVMKESLSFSDAAETQRIQAVARQLVAARLVSTGRDKQGQTYYEPAHDALVRAWARLWEWIKAAGEERLGLMLKLGQAVRDYHREEDAVKAPQFLWDDAPWLDMLAAELHSPRHGFNAQEEQFIRRSLMKRSRRRRRNWTIAVAVMIGLAGLGFFAYLKQNEAQLEAENRRNETERAENEAQLRALAEQETDRANGLATIANQERDRAKRFQDEAERARLNLANANGAFMDNLLHSAERNMASAAFQQAFGNLRSASDFGLSAKSQKIDDNLAADWSTKTKNQLLEVAYFFAESGKPDFILQNAETLFQFNWEPPNAITHLNGYLRQEGSLDEFKQHCHFLLGSLSDEKAKQAVKRVMEQRVREAEKTIDELSGISFLRPRSREIEEAAIEQRTKKRIYEETAGSILPEKHALVKEFVNVLASAEGLRLRQRYYPEARLRVSELGKNFDLTIDSLPYGLFVPEKVIDIAQFSLYGEATGLDITSIASMGEMTEGERPAVRVSWEDGARYANWLSNVSGLDTLYRFEQNEFIGFNEHAKEAFRFPTVPEVKYLDSIRSQIPSPVRMAWCQESLLEKHYAVLVGDYFALPLKSERMELMLVQGSYQHSEQNFLPFRYPLALYFDRDKPERRKRSLWTITDIGYLQAHERYLARKNEIIDRADRSMRQKLEVFFEEEVQESLYSLYEVCEQITPLLEVGWTVTVRFQPPPLRHDGIIFSTYNDSLAVRRIASVKNFFGNFKSGQLSRYLDNGQLILESQPQRSDSYTLPEGSLYQLYSQRIDIVNVQIDKDRPLWWIED